jgi:hypothetical protein
MHEARVAGMAGATTIDDRGGGRARVGDQALPRPRVRRMRQPRTAGSKCLQERLVASRAVERVPAERAPLESIPRSDRHRWRDDTFCTEIVKALTGKADLKRVLAVSSR